MMTPTVVIGAMYGDEGKGLITDFETERLRADVVCRFNGGAQAGHTVRRAGKSHVFGHISSGTFAGADTYLGGMFMVNPLVFETEYNEILAKGFEPKIFVHPSARVTTVYDIMLNQLIEESRGRHRHGSCGLGINETATRHEAGFTLTMNDLKRSPNLVRDRLRTIQNRYLPGRLDDVLPNYQEMLAARNPAAVDFQKVLSVPVEAHAHVLMESSKHLRVFAESTAQFVFEGAQGLGLDEDLGMFPHVTRSITGLPYAIREAEVLDIHELSPVYVTRAYCTRHGAGPLEMEGAVISDARIVDTTNVQNRSQGALRFAPLNLPYLHELIHTDLLRASKMTSDVLIKDPSVAVTCLDQVSDEVFYIDLDGAYRSCHPEDLPSIIEKSLEVPVTHVSRGPSCADVQYLGT